MNDRHYQSPAAFRRAVTDRLRAIEHTSRWRLPQLQRHVAYDRLLRRLYLTDRDWIVKGAAALVAREIGVRETIDIDVYRDMPLAAIEASFRHAAVADLGDWFRFEVGAPLPVADGAPGVRLPVTAFVGATEWAAFHVDLVGSDVRMTGEPDEVHAIAVLSMPDLEQVSCWVYPIVDHIADKIAAIFQRYGRSRAPSTRYKDLVDLVAMVGQVSVAANAQLAALQSELERRQVTLPTEFAVPDRRLWEPGYGAEARRSLLDMGRTLDEALAIVTPFIDPLLDGTASGSWSSTAGRWTPG